MDIRDGSKPSHPFLFRFLRARDKTNLLESAQASLELTTGQGRFIVVSTTGLYFRRVQGHTPRSQPSDLLQFLHLGCRGPSLHLSASLPRLRRHLLRYQQPHPRNLWNRQRFLHPHVRRPRRPLRQKEVRSHGRSTGKPCTSHLRNRLEHLTPVRSSCSSWALRGNVRFLVERIASGQGRKPETDQRLRPIFLRCHNRVGLGRLQYEPPRLDEITLPGRPCHGQPVPVRRGRRHQPHRPDDRLPQSLRVQARNEPTIWVPHSSATEPWRSLSVRCLRNRNRPRCRHGNPPYPRLGLSQVRTRKRCYWAHLRWHQQPCNGIRQPRNSTACSEVRYRSDNRPNPRIVYTVSFLDSFLAQFRHCLLDLHRQKYADDDVQPCPELSPDGLGPG